MTTYYTDWAVGDDGNLGTSEGAGNAWKTIDHAMNTVAAGDTVYVKATGPYLEVAIMDTPGTFGSTTTFEGYTSTPGDGGQATIDAENTRFYCLADSLTTNTMYYVFKNFIFKRAVTANVDISVYDVIFKNCQFVNGVSHGCRHSSSVGFEGCVFGNNGGNGDDSGGFIRYIGCRFDNNTLDGAELSSGGGCCFNCVFAGNGADGIESQMSNGSTLIVIGCTVDGDGKTTNTGIDCSISYRKNLIIVNNIVYDCVDGIVSNPQGTYFISRNNLLHNNTTDYTNFQTFEGEVSTDPQFTDEAGGDYSLGPSSPAREAGYDGYLLNGSAQLRDIGAIESTTGGGGAGGGASRALKDGSQLT